MDNRPIGVFDSGMGGLSVLGAAIQELPNESFIYYGDNKYAPYGIKSEEEIYNRVESIVNCLINKNVKAILIACNTATSVAVEKLRKQYSLPIIAMEPALKLAYNMHPDGNIVVLATELTLKLKKFKLLMQKYGKNAIPIACPYIVEYVESMSSDEENLINYIHSKVNPDNSIIPSAIVLGCTHFIFVKSLFEKLYPNTDIIDGNKGTINQLKRILLNNNIFADYNNKQKITLLSSNADKVTLDNMNKLLETAKNIH